MPRSDYHSRLIAALENARLRRDLTRFDLARALRVSVSTVDAWRYGRRRPCGRLLMRAWWSGPLLGAEIVSEVVRETFGADWPPSAPVPDDAAAARAALRLRLARLLGL